MNKNDTFFKILFAIELALLPMTIFAYLFLPNWSMGLFIAGILLSKIWIELFKNKLDKTHILINAIGDVLIVSTLLIFFMCVNLVNIALGVCVIIFVLLANLLLVVYNNKSMPEIISAIDFCYMLFVCLLLGSFTFVVFNDLVSKIALFALLLTTIVSVLYKLYYTFRYTQLKNKFLEIFKRKK